MARFYVTTPIYYVTDVPHLGHAYTTIVADALARFHRLRGDDTRFLTGTDDHGQKVERMAEARGKTPQAYADDIAAKYREAWTNLHVANDDFIRTTDPDHEAVVQELWTTLERKGDIYLGDYEGWYCVACEQFYTEKELAPGNVCAVHHKPVERVKERSYFFRLSAYEKRLQDFYDDVARRTGRPFIEPQIRMNEVRAFVDAGLKDFSVSRTTFSWGVPAPGHSGHVIYVWIDALTNYYSATRRAALAGFWADDVDIVHLMGKEITRFHAVYWPAVLMAAGLRPPSKIVAHGWWTVDGEKMSKTLGNVVDPSRLAADLGADAFRYFVLREVPLGADGDFSHQALITRYNSELANDLGNLLNRTLGMVAKYLPDRTVRRGDAGADAEALARACDAAAFVEAMEAFQPSRALEVVWKIVRSGNAYIDQSAPWKLDRAGQERVLWNALELCRVLGHLIGPFLPERALRLLAQLGVAERPHLPRWGDGPATFRVEKGEPLFPRIDDDRKRELLARWAPRPAEGAATAAPATAPAEGPARIAYEEFARLDLRVAEIVSASRIPKKDKLLQLTVDLGGERRQVVAGIAAAYAPEELIGRRVIVLANLQPAKIGGVVSDGMILAAGDGGALALSALDKACPPGTKVR